MNASGIGLVVATFLASAVEFVEAFTIVLAMGLTRGWRSTLLGCRGRGRRARGGDGDRRLRARGVVPESALQLIVGTLLLIFGLQWLRKAILRSSG